jgi:hypothetical protein
MKKSFLSTLLIIVSIHLSGQDVIPVQDGDIFTLEAGNVIFEVDASFGGRISSFSIDGNEVLYLSTGGDDFLWGSILWPSPQTWPWPPPFDALEYDAYSGEISDNKIILTSETDDYTDLVFEKTFYANSSDTSISIEYKLINKGGNATEVAAWEVTRVPSGGLTYFPMGEGVVTGNFAGETETIDDVVWYEHSSSDPSGRKFFSDGSEGWFAHVNEDDYLFLKTFEDVPYNDAAPNEAEIELWHADPSTYIELENQSAYVGIPANGEYTYALKWFLRELPQGVEIAMDSKSLLKYTSSVATGTPFTGINSVEVDRVKIYPNPSMGYFSVSGVTDEYDLEILDMSGKVVDCIVDAVPGQKINAELFEKGVYFVRISGKNLDEVLKLIIQ